MKRRKMIRAMKQNKENVRWRRKRVINRGKKELHNTRKLTENKSEMQLLRKLKEKIKEKVYKGNVRWRRKR